MTLDLTDPRLHKCMTSPHAHGAYKVHPYPQISQHLANLIAGVHDLTLFDHPDGETSSGRPPFYDHAHYVGSLAVLYKAMQDIGWIEHTCDWDWWTGLTLRDGTKVGDGYFVYPDHTDDEYDRAEAHGYCDEFIVPAVRDPLRFYQDANPDTNVYAGMAVRLERWTTDGDGDAAIQLYRVDQIASIHINER